ncbi:MAG: DNA repair protein RecO [Thermoleophilia bacterium]|nr:DNA repair protein RecO [Thermoleophilia bacterium]
MSRGMGEGRCGEVAAGHPTLDTLARPLTTEAVVLRSFPFGEADRVLHLYSEAGGRIGAIAKGVRRTKSRFGGRLEPLSHVELVLHRGRGELYTVTGASLVHSHDRIRSDGPRLRVGLIGIEAMTRLFVEEERSERAFLAITRFLDALDEGPLRPGLRPGLEPLGLAFQLKLLWLSGFMPHLDGCVACGAKARLVAFDPAAGGVVCVGCETGGIALSSDGLAGLSALLRSPLADAPSLGLTQGALREALAVVTGSYEHHAGFRLRTLRSS